MSTAATPTNRPIGPVSSPYRGARLRRSAAVVALVAAPVLAAVSELLQPDLDGSASQRLAAMDGVLPSVSAVAFLVDQLPTLVAVLAIGHLLRGRSPLLSTWGTALGVVGAFGHTVFGGMSLVWLAMAGDGPDRATYAAVVDDVMSSPAMLFSLMGLAGTVLGLLLLSIGLFRGHVGPRWVGPALWAFLVVEFVGTSLSHSAVYLSVLCFAAAFLALAAQAARQPLEAWEGPVSPATA